MQNFKASCGYKQWQNGNFWWLSPFLMKSHFFSQKTIIIWLNRQLNVWHLMFQLSDFIFVSRRHYKITKTTSVKPKTEINTKHYLPVASHKECQVCSPFRNVGNNSTNICPAYFEDRRHPQDSYHMAKSEISVNLPPRPLKTGEEVTMCNAFVDIVNSRVVSKTRAESM